MYDEHGAVPEYVVGSDLACSFINNAQTGINIRNKQPNTSSWFNFPDSERTEQDKYELMALQLRNSTGPGKFYKNEQLFKKYHSKFNFGVIVDDHKAKTGLSDDSSMYRSKKNRSGTSLLHELVNDSETQKWTNKKYSEIQKVKMKGAKKWYRMQVLKRKRY